MQRGGAELEARNEDRLRFQINQDTSEWRELRSKLGRLKDGDERGCIAVCISRLNRSKLGHYLVDPIKDDDYPMYPSAYSASCSRRAPR